MSKEKKPWYKKVRKQWLFNPKTRVKPNKKKRRKDKQKTKEELKKHEEI
jgi:hypothetical protein